MSPSMPPYDLERPKPKGDDKPGGKGGKHHDPGPKRKHLTPRNPHWVCLTSPSLHWDLYLLLGEGFVEPSDGTGGWQSSDRYRNTGATIWLGVAPWSMSVPILLDDWSQQLTPDEPDPERKKKPPSMAGRFENAKHTKRKRRRTRERWRRYRDHNAPNTVQDYVDLLIDLGDNEGDREEDPPVFRLYGKAIPAHLNGDAFVLEGIDWGDSLDNDGKLKRQALTLNVIRRENVEDWKVKRRKKRKGGKGKSRTYTVKKGDDLHKIAGKMYGDPSKWKKIAEANDCKNPRDIKVGQKLEIP